MRGKKARALRKKVYGEDYSPRERRYIVDSRGALRNTGRRKAYQANKRRLEKNRDKETTGNTCDTRSRRKGGIFMIPPYIYIWTAVRKLYASIVEKWSEYIGEKHRYCVKILKEGEEYESKDYHIQAE
jgi:hypothetical protein